MMCVCHIIIKGYLLTYLQILPKPIVAALGGDMSACCTTSSVVGIGGHVMHNADGSHMPL